MLSHVPLSQAPDRFGIRSHSHPEHANSKAQFRRWQTFASILEFQAKRRDTALTTWEVLHENAGANKP